jgi:hypothetical protein
MVARSVDDTCGDVLRESEDCTTPKPAPGCEDDPPHEAQAAASRHGTRS